MTGLIIWVSVTVVIFVVLEYFTVRSALRTKELSDPMMRGSAVGQLANVSKPVRIVVGTVGALAGAVLLGMLVSMALFAAFGIEMQ